MNALLCIVLGAVALIALLAIGHSIFIPEWPVNATHLFPGLPLWAVAGVAVASHLLSAWFYRRHAKEHREP